MDDFAIKCKEFLDARQTRRESLEQAKQLAGLATEIDIECLIFGLVKQLNQMNERIKTLESIISKSEPLVI